MTRSGISIAAVVAGLTLAATTPAAALTKVSFSFTAGPTAVHGVYTLDCPPGAGPCTILALDGMFGSTPISRDPDTKPPEPPTPPVEPDNVVTRPNFEPTYNGNDFWAGTPLLHGFLRKEDEDRFLLMIYDDVLQEHYSEYTVTDYQTSVPEPEAWTLLLLGFAGLGAAVRSVRWGRSPSRRVFRLA